MKTVHKHPILNDGLTDVAVGAQVIHAGNDGFRQPCVWVLVNPDEKRVEVRRFRLYGTGQSIEEGGAHLASFVDGVFVWHVFEYAV